MCRLNSSGHFGAVFRALEIYRLRGYSFDKDGTPHGARLLDCTTFVDKLTIMKRNPDAKTAMPALMSKPYRERLEKLRNELAHPRLVERSSLLLVRTEARGRSSNGPRRLKPS